MAVYKITLSKTNWSGGTDAIWYDTVSQSFFADEDCTQDATAVEPPTRELYRFNGFYSSSSGGTQYMDDAGNFTDAFLALSITAAKTFYAQGTQVSYKLTLDDNGGEGGNGALYYKIGSGGYYENYLCEGDPVSSVAKPFKDGNAFAGYYNGTSTPGAQYIDKDGAFTASLDSLTMTGAKTIYAKWVAPYKISVNSNSGGTEAFYFDSISGKFYSGTDMAEEITSIVPRTRECFAFLGCYSSNNTTSTLRVAIDGTIASDWVPTAATTVYAQWQRVSYKVTFNKSSGEGGTDALYYRIDGGGLYADDLCTTAAEGTTPPTRTGYVFKGYYSSSSGGTKYIDRYGAFLSDFTSLTISAAKTIYAQWNAVYKVTLNKANGEGGTDAIWYSAEDAAFFEDEACTVQATSVAPPTRECYSFTGYYNSASGTTQYIDDAGDFTAALSSLSITAAKTFYAQWTRVSYKATLDDNGGAGGSGAFYFDGSTLAFYSDDRLTTLATAVDAPAREGYSFIGYYASASGGSRYVDESGNIIVATALTADLTIYARWQALQYTLTFDYNGGTGGTVSKTVTFGSAVGTLPAPTHARANFAGWFVGGNVVQGIVSGGEEITAATVWDIAGDATATASWIGYFGGVVDYFGLASSKLVPVKSDAGDGRLRTCVANATWSGSNQLKAGRYSSGVSETSGIWRNPSVTYLVVGDFTFSVQLGKAYPATKTGSTMTVSGWMITSIRIATSLKSFPTITVSATANEGANAINLFDVEVPIAARARPQALLGAVTGGGNLQTCDLEATCSPVVCAENGMPCASDVVYGKLAARATMHAPNGEAAPTAANGFTAVGEPKSCGDTDYQMWQITAEKEII